MILVQTQIVSEFINSQDLSRFFVSEHWEKTVVWCEGWKHVPSKFRSNRYENCYTGNTKILFSLNHALLTTCLQFISRQQGARRRRRCVSCWWLTGLRGRASAGLTGAELRRSFKICFSTTTSWSFLARTRSLAATTEENWSLYPVHKQGSGPGRKSLRHTRSIFQNQVFLQ